MASKRGHVQRTIIGALTYAPYIGTLDLVNEVYDLYVPNEPPIPPTRAQLQSVWRALRRLRDEGIISETDRVNRRGHHLWVINRKPHTRMAVNAKLRAQKPRLVG